MGKVFGETCNWSKMASCTNSKGSVSIAWTGRNSPVLYIPMIVPIISHIYLKVSSKIGDPQVTMASILELWLDLGAKSTPPHGHHQLFFPRTTGRSKAFGTTAAELRHEVAGVIWREVQVQQRIMGIWHVTGYDGIFMEYGDRGPSGSIRCWSKSYFRSTKSEEGPQQLLESDLENPPNRKFGGFPK